MSRLHQLNQSLYLANTESELLSCLQEGDAILFIEEAVLKIDQDSPLLMRAISLNLNMYALETDLKTYGLHSNKITSITVDEWLALTAKFDQHTAW